MRDRIAHVERAVKTVFSKRRYQVIGLGSFLFFLALYAFTLPATYTGGRVGLVSLRLLTPTLAAFSFIMAGLVAVILPFTAYTIQIGGSSSATATTSGVVGSVLPPLLCCSPLLPIIAASVAGVFPAAFGVSGYIQGFVATYETEILLTATGILGYALYRSAETVNGCRIYADTSYNRPVEGGTRKP